MEKHYPRMFPKHCEVRDRGTYKPSCNTIKTTKQRADELEASLRAAGLYEPHAGRFWNHPVTRAYHRARFDHAQVLIRSWRRQGIEDALAIYLDLLQLDRGDHQACRQVVPALFLRLERDQECYDFLKWWQVHNTTSPASYNWNDTTQRYLDIKGADATEPADLWKGEHFLNLPQLVTLHLLKMRLWRTLQLAQRCRHANPGFTGEQVVARIREERHTSEDFRGNILEKRPELAGDNATLDAATERVVESLEPLLAAMRKTNRFYVTMVMFPDMELFERTGPPKPYTPGSEEEAELAFNYTYSAWCESPGAIDVLRQVLGATPDVMDKAMKAAMEKMEKAGSGPRRS
ncbi:hypothetical protein B0T25DRAFT_587834 [Lasiosphaeria hispida]|uniref:Uncharacterized protein n=1 Tax=Lasiosphaeria hispida TaxID=260671 RepID=A0AAJ0HXF0_9PEZI|nr:hypothetical protein B0T25DRAFT_587834 [Lasiosphaeria hispida]